jgi:glycosyltransferase involved in cell wall biosynthesis
VRVALDVSAVPARLAGAGRYSAEIARRLPLLGVETTLVTRRDDASRWHQWSPGASISPIVPDDRARRLAFEAWRLGTSEAARHVEVWHAPHYTMPRRGSTPTVVTIHDLTFFTNPEWHERSKVAFFRRAIRYSAAHADVLISVSDFTARQIEELIPHHAPLIVASLGVNLEQFTADSSRDRDLFHAHGLAVDVPYVFFLGTIEPRKGLDVLLEAFIDVARSDESIELWLAGQVGWGIKEFDQTLARHPAASRIRRLGFVDDAVLPALLRQSRAVAYPSRGEGFGLPVLEAMACGATVVTTSETVMADVAGDAASLVPIGDARALADALSRAVAASAGDRSERSVRARARAELFTWDASLGQHLRAYEMARTKS